MRPTTSPSAPKSESESESESQSPRSGSGSGSGSDSSSPKQKALLRHCAPQKRPRERFRSHGNNDKDCGSDNENGNGNDNENDNDNDNGRAPHQPRCESPAQSEDARATTRPRMHRGIVLLRTIGEGSYGVVRLAVHVTTGRRFAVKIVPVSNLTREGKRSDDPATPEPIGEGSATESALTTLRREISIHSLAVHPNIIRLHDSYETPSCMFIFLELAAGGELFDKIMPDVGLDNDVAHMYFCQLLSAVTYLHSRRIAHRDLKPENLLLDEAGNLKLSDFGMAVVYSRNGSARRLSQACGTPPYTAPEVLRGAYDGELADVWSMGTILHVMRMGATLWHEPTSHSAAFKEYVSERHDGKPPRALAAVEPASLRDLFLKLLDMPRTRIRPSALPDHEWVRAPNKLLAADGSCADPSALATRLAATMAAHASAPINQPSAHTSTTAAPDSTRHPVKTNSAFPDHNHRAASGFAHEGNESTGQSPNVNVASDMIALRMSQPQPLRRSLNFLSDAAVSSFSQPGAMPLVELSQHITMTQQNFGFTLGSDYDARRSAITLGRGGVGGTMVPELSCRLTRFFTAVPVPALLAVTVGVLTRLRAITSSQPSPVENPEPGAVCWRLPFIATDSHGYQLCGSVIAQPVTTFTSDTFSPRKIDFGDDTESSGAETDQFDNNPTSPATAKQQPLLLVLFLRRRGDTIEFKRFFSSFVSQPEIARIMTTPQTPIAQATMLRPKTVHHPLSSPKRKPT